MPFDEKDVTVLRPFWFLRRLLQEQTNRRGLSAKLLNPIDLKLNPETCETESGMMYRRGAGQTETKKRQPPIPHPLLAHMRRCEKTGALWVVEVDGQRVVSVSETAWARAVKEAGIDHCTRHNLRHTSITWAMQRGMERWIASGFFGVSMDVLDQTYAHFSLDYLHDAAKIMGRRR